MLVVDPPRKGLDSSLVDALQTIASAERKAKLLSERSDCGSLFLSHQR